MLAYIQTMSIRNPLSIIRDLSFGSTIPVYSAGNKRSLFPRNPRILASLCLRISLDFLFLLQFNDAETAHFVAITSCFLLLLS